MAEKVVVQLVLDTSRYTSGASNAARSTAKIQGAADKTSKSVSGLRGTAIKAGAALGAVFVAKAALDFAKSSIAAFSNLEESINAVNVSYLEGSDAIHAIGEDSATQFGLSTRAVNDAAVAMSAFASKIDEADPPGAFENVLQRATDFASVMNLEVEDALRLFQSGLAGESEPLRKFGIDVSAATVTTVGLAAGLGDANGKLSEGEKIQARYLAIMEQTEKTAGDFANTSEGLANRQKTLSAEWEEAQALIGEELEPAMLSLLEASTLLVPIFVKVATKVASLVDEFNPLIKALVFVVDLIDDAGGAGNELEATSQNWLKSFTARSQELRTSTLPAVVGIFGEMIGVIDDTEDVSSGLVGTVELMENRFRRAAVEAEFMAGRLPIQPLDEFGNAIEEVSTTQGNALGPAARYALAISLAGARAREAAASELERAAGIRAGIQAQAEAASPVLRQLRAQERLVAAQERRVELQGLTGEDKATAEELAGALLDVAEAQVEVNIANVNLAGSFEESREALIAALVTAGATNEEIQALADTIGTFPTSIDFQLNVTTAGDVGALLRSIDRAIPGRQHGGPVTRGQPVIVGERRPELFIPSHPGVISPNTGVGSINVTVNQPETLDFASDLAAGLIAAQITQQVEMLRT